MPPRSTRKRTEAQRQSKDGVDTTENINVVQDEQEQEAEIAALRNKDASDNRVWRNLLDIVVTVCTVMSGAQTLRLFNSPSSSLPLRVLSLAQTLILPLSLTPNILPRFSSITSKNHNTILVTQMGIFMVAFYILRSQNVTSGTNLEWAEWLRWALPELVTGAVEIQRRSERDSAASIDGLEDKKYKLKGA